MYVGDVDGRGRLGQPRPGKVLGDDEGSGSAVTTWQKVR